MMAYLEEDLNMHAHKIVRLMQKKILQSKYFGINAHKCPLDFWMYQEIIYDTKPDIIIEIGTGKGGATLALAHLLENIGKGMIISIDIDQSQVAKQVRDHYKIVLLEDDATQSVGRVKSIIRKEESVMIIEDSSHTYDNTLQVLRLYSPLVTPGNYFIVEDSNCHHGLNHGPEPGPYEAIEAFMEDNEEFEIDRSKEAFFITWNPKGYLKRK